MDEHELGAKALKKLRELLGLTQAELAARIGVTTEAIIAVENRRNRLTVEMNRKISVTFGATCLMPVFGDQKVKWVPYPGGDVKPIGAWFTDERGEKGRFLPRTTERSFTKLDCSKHYAMGSANFEETVRSAQEALRELFEDARAIPSDSVKQPNLPATVAQFYWWLQQMQQNMKFGKVVSASKPSRKTKEKPPKKV